MVREFGKGIFQRAGDPGGTPVSVAGDDPLSKEESSLRGEGHAT